MVKVVRRILSTAFLTAALNTSAATPPTVVTTPPQPKWVELNADQKLVLAPLVADWDDMENYRRKRWLEIATRWPRMSREDRFRTWDRMRDWAKLTSSQKKTARERFRTFKALPPARQAELQRQWEAYNKLSEEEKLRFKQKQLPPSERKHPVQTTVPQ